MTCRDCPYFAPSTDPTRPGSGLAGYGYCRNASTAELRARFFPADISCWLAPSRKQAEPQP